METNLKGAHVCRCLRSRQFHVLQLHHAHTVPAPSRQRQDKLKFEVSLGYRLSQKQQYYQNITLHVWKHIGRTSHYLY